MPFNTTDLFSFGTDLHNAAGLQTVNDEYFVGVDEKIIRKAAGGTGFLTFYDAPNRNTAIPFFYNGNVKGFEYDPFDGQVFDAFVKKDLDTTPVIIANIELVYRVYYLGEVGGKAFALVQNNDSSIPATESDNLYVFDNNEETGTSVRTDFPIGTNLSPQVKGASIDPDNGNLLLLASAVQNDEQNLLVFNGNGFTNEGNLGITNYFGFHKVSGETRLFRYFTSTQTLKLYSRVGGTITEIASFANVQGNSTPRRVIVEQNDDFVFCKYERSNETYVHRYKKSDLTVETNLYNEEVQIMQFSPAFEGIGVGNTFKSFVITAPNPDEPPQEFANPFILYPKANPIRFVRSQNYSVHNPKNINNSLYCEIKHNNIRRPFFAQTYLKEDLPEIQFQSNAKPDSVTLEVFDQRNNKVKDLSVNTLFNAINEGDSYNVSINIDSVTGGRFLQFGGTGKIPSELSFLQQGGQIRVQNSTDTNIDGFFTITSIVEGAGTAPDKVLFNYSGTVASGTTADVTFFPSGRVNNIYGATVDLTDQSEGYYRLKLSATTQAGTVFYDSELIYFADSFAEDETVLVKYSNNDNFFRVNYSLTTEFKIRITGRFFYQEPGGDKELMQDCDFDDVIIRAVPENAITFEAQLQPYYIHKILNLAFQHDNVVVQGVQVTTGNDYSVDRISDLYALVNGSIQVKEKDYANEFNDIDSGINDVDGGNVLGANDGQVIGY